VDQYLSRRPLRIGLVVVSVAAAVSMGGGFFAGVLLAPLLIRAARHVSTFAAAGLVLLATILVAEVAWGITYLLVGEHRPLIWFIPAVASLAAATLGAWSVGVTRSPSAS